MKITANATAYGSPIEMNVIEHRKSVGVTVHRSDGTSYPVRMKRTEKPGGWFSPLIATLVSGAGRLLLATAMRLIDDFGGCSASNDTDSLFIVATEQGGSVVCPGGSHRSADGAEAVRALSWPEVERIVDAFGGLNPYDRRHIAGSILDMEDENDDPSTGRQREIQCFAIAAKRYGLFVVGEDRRPEVVGMPSKLKRSEHGLGHLLPPNAEDPEIDDRQWLDRWWRHLLCLELGIDDEEPDWFDDPAVGRLTVNSPRDLEAFKQHNAGRPYLDQVRPGNFLVMAHPTQFERARGLRCLIGAFERDPEARKRMPWLDRGIAAARPRQIRTSDPYSLRTDSACVLSYGDYFADYREHPEAKALDRDGWPCHRWTRGLLGPRHVLASSLSRVGKESNRLSEDPLPVDDESESVIEYPEARRCRGCGAEVVSRQKWWCSDVCRKRLARRRRSSQQLRSR